MQGYGLSQGFAFTRDVWAAVGPSGKGSHRRLESREPTWRLIPWLHNRSAATMQQCMHCNPGRATGNHRGTLLKPNPHEWDWREISCPIHECIGVGQFWTHIYESCHRFYQRRERNNRNNFGNTLFYRAQNNKIDIARMESMLLIQVS